MKLKIRDKGATKDEILALAQATCLTKETAENMIIIVIINLLNNGHLLTFI